MLNYQSLIQRGEGRGFFCAAAAHKLATVTGFSPIQHRRPVDNMKYASLLNDEIFDTVVNNEAAALLVAITF